MPDLMLNLIEATRLDYPSDPVDASNGNLWDLRESFFEG